MTHLLPQNNLLPFFFFLEFIFNNCFVFLLNCVFINVFLLSINGSKNYEQQTKFASENEMLKEADMIRSHV